MYSEYLPTCIQNTFTPYSEYFYSVFRIPPPVFPEYLPLYSQNTYPCIPKNMQKIMEKPRIPTLVFPRIPTSVFPRIPTPVYSEYLPTCIQNTFTLYSEYLPTCTQNTYTLYSEYFYFVPRILLLCTRNT